MGAENSWYVFDYGVPLYYRVAASPVAAQERLPVRQMKGDVKTCCEVEKRLPESPFRSGARIRAVVRGAKAAL
jgi:hypothetical protein